MDQGEESAVAELKRQMEKEKHMFLQPHPDFITGELSWTWPPMPICKQKLAQQQKIDPTNEYTARGAHMPLMVFIREKNKTPRSAKAKCGRKERVTTTGGPPERIQAFKMNQNAQTWASSGAGAQSSSSQQVNGTRGGGGQPSSAYGSRSASGWSGNSGY